MKKILSSLILIFITPLKWIKRLKFNSFVGGLIFGAIFSLIVNIATVQVQELITKQRTLEAIENEIMLNVLQANNILEKNLNEAKNNKHINYFYYSRTYSNDFWAQSSEGLRYVAQLDPDIQGKIMLFYNLLIRETNGLIERTNDLLKQLFSKCFTSKLVFMENATECIKLEYEIRTLENMGAEIVSKHGIEVLQEFNPTQERLNKWYLRLLMGSKSAKILSGK